MILNPTAGFDGCLGQTAQFSVSQTPFLNFLYVIVFLPINLAKLHVKSLKNGLSLNSSRLFHFATTSKGYA